LGNDIGRRIKMQVDLLESILVRVTKGRRGNGHGSKTNTRSEQSTSVENGGLGKGEGEILSKAGHDRAPRWGGKRARGDQERGGKTP